MINKEKEKDMNCITRMVLVVLGLGLVVLDQGTSHKATVERQGIC